MLKNAQQIEDYLDALACELVVLGVTTPFHIVLTGGAYMLLQQQRRSTADIDFALITGPRRAKPGVVFQATIQRGQIAGRTSRIPNANEFKEAAALVAEQYGLPDDWMNDEGAVYLYDDAPEAEVYLWRTFRGVLIVYLPTAEYVFALKVAAYRQKDLKDIQVLVRQLDIQTRAEAQEIIDRYLLPEAQTFWEVARKLRRLFR